MEWMQCNSCWLKVENRQSQFHLTQCGHVYCDKCIVLAEKRCYQCGTANTISLPLKDPLNPQIAHYFSKPADLLEKVIQAAQFQESQRSLYLKQLETTQSKYQSLKEAYWASTDNLKKVYIKYNKLKMMLALMQKDYKKMAVPNPNYSTSQYETPPSQLNNSISKIGQRNGKQDYFDNKNFNDSKRDDPVFRVPTITKVPRSAGYYTASSTSSYSSNHRTTTPNSKFSNY